MGLACTHTDLWLAYSISVSTLLLYNEIHWGFIKSANIEYKNINIMHMDLYIFL